MGLELGGGVRFDALYEEVGPRLWRAVLAYTGGQRELTDDVVAEAFTRTLERGDDVRSPEAYVYRVAFRIAARELRRSRSTEPVRDERILDDPGLVELFDALRQLSPGQRAALYLRYAADLPVDEVARVMGTSAGVVRMHLLRGRRRMATVLGGEDDA